MYSSQVLGTYAPKDPQKSTERKDLNIVQYIESSIDLGKF